MQFRITLLVVLICTAFSCQLLDITKNEKKGIDEVLAIYGGVCKYSVEGTISTEKEDRQWKLVLEVSGSELIDKTPDQAEAFAAGIAYTYFKHLQEEKDRYSHIKTVLVGRDSSQQVFEFELDELALVMRKMPIAERMAAHIVAKKYNAVGALLLDSSYLLPDKQVLLQRIAKTELELDSAVAYVPLGFWLKRIEGHRNLHVVGQIKRVPVSTSFSVDIDMDDDRNKAACINYTY